jgi:hypothetical protein
MVLASGAIAGREHGAADSAGNHLWGKVLIEWDTIGNL